jgi:hypothetical protein
LHSLALTANGTVVGWGLWAELGMPKDLKNVIAISAGEFFSVAIVNDVNESVDANNKILDPLTERAD